MGTTNQRIIRPAERTKKAIAAPARNAFSFIAAYKVPRIAMKNRQKIATYTGSAVEKGPNTLLSNIVAIPLRSSFLKKEYYFILNLSTEQTAFLHNKKRLDVIAPFLKQKKIRSLSPNYNLAGPIQATKHLPD